MEARTAAKQVLRALSLSSDCHQSRSTEDLQVREKCHVTMRYGGQTYKDQVLAVKFYMIR